MKDDSSTCDTWGNGCVFGDNMYAPALVLTDLDSRVNDNPVVLAPIQKYLRGHLRKSKGT